MLNFVETIICLQPPVRMVTFVWLVLAVTDMEGLKCVSIALGEPSVMTFGTTVMPVWCVGSWDTLHMVSCHA